MAISYNVPITFGRNGTAKGLNCTGIDFSEDGAQSWTSAAVAEMDIQLPPARQDVFVQIEASPFLVPELVPVQQVFVFLGGLFVGFYMLRGHDVKTLPIARNVIAARPGRMCFVLPNATSPSASYLSEDMRELGIYLNAIVFKTAG
ncbi:MAG TPA: hypothetical protein DDZ81_16345 [Acetobacteraceae bacterium]|nr:hypothetical protein [Acetobacteraceae bacterium]